MLAPPGAACIAPVANAIAELTGGTARNLHQP